MAHATLLPDNILQPVIKQLGNLLSGLVSQQSLVLKKVEMGEAFRIWLLDTCKISEPEIDFNDLVLPTDYWHHQILFDGVAKAYGRSKLESGNQLQALTVHLSDIPMKIAEAIYWIDTSISDDTLVQLLIVPSYSVYAFWLVNLKKVYVIDFPPMFTHLKPKLLLDLKDFRDRVLADLQVIRLRLNKNRQRS